MDCCHIYKYINFIRQFFVAKYFSFSSTPWYFAKSNSKTGSIFKFFLSSSFCRIGQLRTTTFEICMLLRVDLDIFSVVAHYLDGDFLLSGRLVLEHPFLRRSCLAVYNPFSDSYSSCEFFILLLTKVSWGFHFIQ